mgnify:CR=1 FL=1
MAQAEPKVRWDGTISLGSIIAMIGIAAPVVVASITVVNKVDSIQHDMKESNSKTDGRLQNLEEITQQIRLDMAKQDGVRMQVQDHEARIRQLENRG